MLEPIQPGSHYSVRNLEELNGLLTAKNVLLLEIAGDAILEITTIAMIVTQNKNSLQEIRLDAVGYGLYGKFAISAQESEALANAINSCRSLRSLAIKSFYNSFRENIKYFTDCLDHHNELRDLSFDSTYLGEYATGLLKSLETHQKLKRINLANTALIYRANWNQFAFTLQNNNCLEELILGRTASRLLAVSSLLDGITSSSSKVKCLQWDFLPLAESESLHWHLDKAVNWAGDKDRDAVVDCCLEEVEDYRRTGRHLLKADYSVAEVKYNELKTFVAERNDPTPKTSYSFTINNEQDFSLAILSAKIALHANSLCEVNILLDSIELDNPWFSDREFSIFISALRKCVNLRQFKFEHMQGIFKSDQIRELFCVVARLPQLQVVSFKKTYIGPSGIEELETLTKNNKMTSLDLTLSGLISDDCFRVLAAAIKTNTSLETLMLGASPMTAMWLQILTEGIRKRSSQAASLNIVWKISEKDVMKSQMLAMCLDLIQDRRSLRLVTMMNNTLNIFHSQVTVDLRPNWMALQRLVKPSTYQELSGILPKDPKEPAQVAIEMQPVATDSSRLLNRSTRSYGTREGSISTHDKDAKSGRSPK